MKRSLTISLLKKEAALFAAQESIHSEPILFGVTDGKAVGTYLEHKFQEHILDKYTHIFGSSAKGIDLPGLNVDIKTTSIKQPQSSCPFKSARQKIYGLGYHLLIFVYEKTDDHKRQTGRLNILHSIFVDQTKTADFQTTSGLLSILKNEGNTDDIIGFLAEKMLPIDDIQAQSLAEEILKRPPVIGYLTISNALQWRLQYNRAIQSAGIIDGIDKL